MRAVAAEPRPAGGTAEARARAYCADELRAAGFDVREEPFAFSDAVGRWAMPLSGAIWAVAAGLAARAGASHRAGAALAIATGALALVFGGAHLATSAGVLGLPFSRRRSVNLVATRGAVMPRVWLVAHLDSKSQPVPMSLRVAGVATSLAVAAAVVACALLALAGASPGAGTWRVLGALGVVCAIPVIGSGIGARSPGALDDASGVATVLIAATHAELDAPPLPGAIGVLLTSAEELALAGARAWARDLTGRPSDEPLVALNVDVVDDVGVLRVMTASPLPPALDDAIDRECAAGVVRRGRLPAGVLVDAIALASRGLAALTVSKATVGSLARVHTRRDVADLVRGEGVAAAAGLVRRLACAVATPPAAA